MQFVNSAHLKQNAGECYTVKVLEMDDTAVRLATSCNHMVLKFVYVLYHRIAWCLNDVRISHKRLRFPSLNLMLRNPLNWWDIFGLEQNYL